MFDYVTVTYYQFNQGKKNTDPQNTWVWKIVNFVILCLYIYIYIYIYTHTHTHTYIYIYIYIYQWLMQFCLCCSLNSYHCNKNFINSTLYFDVFSTVHHSTADCSLLSTGVVYSRLGERGYQLLCLCSCSSWGWACQGPKHVEDSNVTYMCYWIVH